MTLPLLVDRSPELQRGAKPNEPTSLIPPSLICETFIVSDEIIARSKRGDGAACAIARVIKQRHPDWAVDISGEYPLIKDTRISLPQYIVDWIGKFDRGEPVGEVSFSLYY